MKQQMNQDGHATKLLTAISVLTEGIAKWKKLLYLLPLLLFLTQADAQKGFIGVWQPGSGGMYWHTGLNFSAFNSKVSSYYKKGFYLTDIEVNNGKFSGIWRKKSGGMYWHTGLSFNDFNAKVNSFFKKGYYLVDIEIVNGKYTGIWHKGSGGMYWYTGLSYSAFNAKVNSFFKKGYYLSDVEIYNGKYTGIWRKGSGGMYWYTGLSFKDFNAKISSFIRKGFRLKDVEIYNGKYTGVWTKGNGAQYWWSGLNHVDIKTTVGAFMKNNLYLTDIELHPSPRSLYKLPFDNVKGWKLTNGNWDDKIPGHGGKKTGLQAYSFDFVFDANNDGIGEENQNIRAARAGLVHLVVENEKENSRGKNFCKHGVGNYVVIKHDDGTYGTYWHLKYNSVVVNKGKRVRQGALLAKGGNTGNSSTAHLHFDVRTGWNDKYNKCNLSGTELPNVRITFQDNNHKYWIPRVGDKLSSNNR